jgi:hypothetical protein
VKPPAPSPDHLHMTDHTESDAFSPRSEVRMATKGLSCHAGHVLDMSGGGMRVVVPWSSAPRVGDPETYIFGEGPEELRLMATVRWVRPAGRLHKRVEIGV